jgi:hypothetical protein
MPQKDDLVLNMEKDREGKQNPRAQDKGIRYGILFY